jgi:hypothetical protein
MLAKPQRLLRDLPAQRAAKLSAIEKALPGTTGWERDRLLLSALNLCGGLPYWLHKALCETLAARVPAADASWMRWDVVQALHDQGMPLKVAKAKARELLRGTAAEAGEEMILKDYKSKNRKLGRQRRYRRKPPKG